MQIKLGNIWLGKIEVHDSKHDEFKVINNRLMNARQWMILTKNKTIFILVRMPKLFYQGRDHNNFIVDKPTKYNKFWVKVRKLKIKLKEML